MSFDSNPDPGRTLGQFGIAVLALVVGAALLFFGIDRFSDDQPSTAASSPTATDTATAAESPDVATEDPTTEPSAPASEAPTDPPASPDPTDTATEDATSDDSPTPSDEPTDDGDDGDDGEGTDRIDPGEISIQVLDAIKEGDRAQEIADEMEDDGYRVVAFNPSSIVYETTTVFYTEGYEDEANQVADDYGWDEVVFNDILSETVNVHVVVGTDEQ